jgi:hypothetical protein
MLMVMAVAMTVAVAVTVAVSAAASLLPSRCGGANRFSPVSSSPHRLVS